MSDTKGEALSYYYAENGKLESKIKKMQKQIATRDEYINELESYLSRLELESDGLMLNMRMSIAIADKKAKDE